MSKSRDLAVEVIFTAFQVLKENDGELAGNKVLEEVGKRANLDDWAKATYEKSGYIRWQSILHFFTIDCIKAGFLIKKKGIWYLTKDGEDAMELGRKKLFDKAIEKYKEWAEKNQKKEISPSEPNDELLEKSEKSSESLLEEAERNSYQSISDAVFNMDAYEFQDLCAALLRGMGYYVTFVASKGKDGGIDIIAQKDPLGVQKPRVKIQVKHRENTKVTPQELRELKGLLSKEEDIGVFIAIAGFTNDAKKEFRNSNPHIELIDLENFIELWKEFYSKMQEEDKNLLPIIPVYFLDKLK